MPGFFRDESLHGTNTTPWPILKKTSAMLAEPSTPCLPFAQFLGERQIEMNDATIA